MRLGHFGVGREIALRNAAVACPADVYYRTDPFNQRGAVVRGVGRRQAAMVHQPGVGHALCECARGRGDSPRPGARHRGQTSIRQAPTTRRDRSRSGFSRPATILAGRRDRGGCVSDTRYYRMVRRGGERTNPSDPESGAARARGHRRLYASRADAR